ncbi:MAG: HEAT repeat domain-containing protein [Verrucomicrobia bacterium]|nr:HEAT repeat domain-containing protein [Verrucomicrobiota bacterium]
MRKAPGCWILILAFAACSRPELRLSRQAHGLIEQGKIQEAQVVIENGLRQFPDSPDLRQQRMLLHLLAGQAELAAAEARQILQTHPSAHPYQAPLRDPSPAVRCSALRAVALDPPHGVVPSGTLQRALHDSDPTVRREAVEVTRLLQNSEALSLLRQAARDPDWLTRAAAARLLGNRADPQTLPDLFVLLADHDSYVRRFARRSLLELAGQARPEAYLPALSSSDRTTQVVAALALARLNDGRGIEILLAEIANPMGIERAEAVKSAARVRDPRVLPALRTATSDADSEVRVVALIALGLLQDRESSALLKKVYADPTAPRQVHLAAGKALDLLSQPPTKAESGPGFSPPAPPARK